MLFKREVTSNELRNAFPAIFAESEKETLSDKYLYIPTYKLVEGLESQGFKVVGAKAQRTRNIETREHGKHVVYLSHETVSKALAVNEEMPLLALTNSHNGLSSFAIDTAFFRLVCSNGLMLPTNSMSSARIVHKVGMERDVIEASMRVIQAFPEQVERIRELKSIQLTTQEQALLAQSATNLAFEPEVIELNKSLGNDIASKLVRPRRSADYANDLWTTFNRIQENVIKGGIRVVSENEQGQRSVRKTRAVNSIDRDSKLNKELMTLAQEFAKLKGA